MNESPAFSDQQLPVAAIPSAHLSQSPLQVDSIPRSSEENIFPYQPQREAPLDPASSIAVPHYPRQSSIPLCFCENARQNVSVPPNRTFAHFFDACVVAGKCEPSNFPFISSARFISPGLGSVAGGIAFNSYLTTCRSLIGIGSNSEKRSSGTHS